MRKDKIDTPKPKNGKDPITEEVPKDRAEGLGHEKKGHINSGIYSGLDLIATKEEQRQMKRLEGTTSEGMDPRDLVEEREREVQRNKQILTVNYLVEKIKAEKAARKELKK